jgi:hypothetical protein
MEEINPIRNQVLLENEKIAIKAISGNIFTLIRNIRNGANDEAYQRRWVWELLQNAMDTTNSERPTDVEILVDNVNSELIFRHNGNPFKIDNITRLVNQQSSKPRSININERKRTIGKFGTGFITTHLLSEKVTLKSTVDANENGHKYFSILLDRSGKDELALYEGVSKSMEVLLNLDTLPNVVNYNYSELNTDFVYHLDVNGINVAKKGIDDLSRSLPFTMAFIKTINQVEIKNDVVYKYLGYEVINENINLHNISISNKKNIQILTIESLTEDAIIAIEVNINGNGIEFIALDENQPRLFCNYPFIGTESLNIPVVFNSSSFNVFQERRNGITLKDANTDEILENKKLMIECKNLFVKLLGFLTNDNFKFSNTYVLANFTKPNEFEWLSKSWYENFILNPIHENILKALIVEVLVDGNIIRRSIISENGNFVMFPYHKEESIRNQIYNLCNQTNYFVLPLFSHIHFWHKMNWWNEKHYLSIKYLGTWFSSFTKVDDLLNVINIESTKFINWCEELFSLFNKDEILIGNINQNKLRVYPNQKGDLLTKNRIYLDNGEIPEELKDILFLLSIDIRGILLDIKLYISGGIAIDKEKVKDVKDIVAQIKDQVSKYNSDKMKGIQLSEEIQIAFKTLYLWLCKNIEYSEIFGDLYTNKEARLLDEATIKSTIERDSQTMALFEKYGISNLYDLEKLIEKGLPKIKENIKPEDLLISLGITSLDELERAKLIFADNKEITEALSHISSSDYEKLEKVLKLINRSKLNVKRKLQDNPSYDCSNWEETSITTINGIVKNGLHIKLVIRPGDGGQIILFYPEEYATLENNINELWYDNEKEQAIYTFGRFLKRAKISKMPI